LDRVVGLTDKTRSTYPRFLRRKNQDGFPINNVGNNGGVGKGKGCYENRREEQRNRAGYLTKIS